MWRDMVKKYMTKGIIRPPSDTVVRRADEMYAVQKQIPRDVLIQLLRRFESDKKEGSKVYVIGKHRVSPAIVINATRVR